MKIPRKFKDNPAKASELDYATIHEFTKGVIDSFVVLMKNNYMESESPI